MQSNHFYRVRFREPIRGRSDFYFGSLSAIYDLFTVDQIGCSKSHLWNVKVSDGIDYHGRRCSISLEVLNRKKQKGGDVCSAQL